MLFTPLRQVFGVLLTKQQLQRRSFEGGKFRREDTDTTGAVLREGSQDFVWYEYTRKCGCFQIARKEGHKFRFPLND